MIFICPKCNYIDDIENKPGTGLLWWMDYIQCPQCKQEIKNPLFETYGKETKKDY